MSQISRLKSASPVDRAAAMLREPQLIIPGVRRRIRRPVALDGTAQPFTDTAGPEFFAVLSPDGARSELTRDPLLLKFAREAGVSQEIRFA